MLGRAHITEYYLPAKAEKVCMPEILRFITDKKQA